MKLIVTIVDDEDVDKIMKVLTSENIGVTRVSSTGGFINPGNSTLLIGVDEQNVAHVMQLISGSAAPRKKIIPYGYHSMMPLPDLVEVPAGGFITFVLAINHFEQV